MNGIRLGLPLTYTSLAVTRSYLKDHRDVVVRLLQGYQEGWTFSADPANQAAVVRSLEKWTKTDERLATISYDYI
ncbi:MAG: hypothetical protein ACHQ7M_05580, partial [Chloroflexota bacterium]